jgi:hypothetical protein
LTFRFFGFTPLTGLIVQPIVAIFRQNWTSGEENPILVGAILASAALFIMPFSLSVVLPAGMLDYGCFDKYFHGTFSCIRWR